MMPAPQNLESSEGIRQETEELRSNIISIVIENTWDRVGSCLSRAALYIMHSFRSVREGFLEEVTCRLGKERLMGSE